MAICTTISSPIWASLELLDNVIVLLPNGRP